MHMTDVARALDAAHRAGVVHRDLKPSNIFLHQEPSGITVAKVLDFGVSKLTEESTVMGLTVEGTLLGSPLYMSPEQAAGASQVDGRSDIFSFGAILFEALTGVRPYDGASVPALLLAVASQDAKRMDDVAPQYPDALRTLVDRCLSRSPDLRPPSCANIVEVLERCLPSLETLRAPLPLPRALKESHSGAAAVETTARRRQGPAISTAPVALSRGERGADGRSGDAEWMARLGRAWSRAPLAVRRGAFVGAALCAGVLAAVSIGTLRSRGAAARAARGSPTHATAGQEAPSDGRLTVSTDTGPCEVTVDGIGKGAAPVELAVVAGAHSVECRVANGTMHRARIDVAPGGHTRYRFSLQP
jgi:serine/threonine-protein kinase